MSDSNIAVRLSSALDDEGASIVSAYLFGSEAEGRSHRQSDVDLGVLLAHDRLPSASERFAERLALLSRLGMPEGRAIDLVILNDAPPLLARHIVTHGRRLTCSDPEADHAFVRDAQLRAADLEPFMRRMRRIKLDRLADA
jgi:predicted nucleotidyltransferase